MGLFGKPKIEITPAALVADIVRRQYVTKEDYAELLKLKDHRDYNASYAILVGAIADGLVSDFSMMSDRRFT